MNAESAADTSTSTCARCGRTLPGDSPGQLCPYCLLSSEATEPTSAQHAATHFDPPTPDDLQFYFPQLQVGQLIGQGGMGAVYRARQQSLGRDVALKILPPEVAAAEGFTERFAREARALARLAHPHVVAVFDHGTAGPYAYLVMELVEGINLRQMMAAGPLPAEEVLRIVPQLCDALQFAHRQGVIHRDIKPENILIDDAGHVKITDFGLAKVTAGGDDRARTATRQVMGTLHYMAPEQFERPRDVDHRADLYSLGVVFYELLTGELPLGRFDPPSRKSSAGRQVDDVVMKSLEKEPNRRYASAEEIRSDLQRGRGDGERWKSAAQQIDRHVRQASRTAFTAAGHAAGEWLQLGVVVLHVVFYALVCAAIGLVLDTRGAEWVAVAIWMALGLWAAAYVVHAITRLTPLPPSLAALGRPVAAFARFPQRLWDRLTHAAAVVDGLRLPLIAAAWVALAFALLLLMGAVIDDDDLFVGAITVLIIAWALARLALPRGTTLPTANARWLVYPPVMGGALMAAGLMLLWPLAAWMILTAVEPQWIEHLLAVADAPYLPASRYRLLRLHVLGAICAESAWLLLLAALAAVSPEAVRWVARPLLDDWRGSGRWWILALCFVAFAIAVSLWSL